MRDRLIELLTEIRNNPRATCPRHNNTPCEGCKYDFGDDCDVVGRVVDFIIAGVEIAQAHGEWLEENRRPKSTQFICSACGGKAYAPQATNTKNNSVKKHCPYKYCPNCGAKMERSNENAE